MKSQSFQAIQPSEVPVKINGNISYKKRREELNEVVKRHIEMKKQTQKNKE
ncbi:hypothetical protein [Rickettsia tamurae]|uniref:Uncharacterized protein n=1 Tax=Rickettsia tamurae subsp. buchneri TaxID=1462938 RepID=A0A8E1BZD9_9RICK|nr:hypothetical protein [Rickettsia tamurae]EER20888.1 hypothetical protein REIS_2135 [Rickettsia endosymbiont of Ixodes scapularis]KDO02243.1 hypothetical protein REISMN_08225 [Rickettsia tamurae subsp. buchneri]